MIPSDEQLLADALAQFGWATSGPLGVRPLPINPGVSGIGVRRFEVTPAGGSPQRLVTKPCGLAERRTLAVLGGLEGVPRAFVPDVETDDMREIVMEDAGETLLGFDPGDRERAATALAGVHARFFGRAEELAWMPHLDRPYLDGFIVDHCWRRAWAGALKDGRVVDTFGKWVEPVEASVRTLADDLLAFEARANVSTLAHTDVYYGHIFEQGGRALVIDWGQARYAPFFLDLGDTFDTPEAAEVYRRALEARGITVDDGTFTEGHALARRFAGIRYLWWWLDSWRREPQDWNRGGLERTLRMAAGM